MQVFKKILRAVGGILATLVILLLVAFWTINLVNWNKHKGILIGGVEKFTDYRVDELDGIRIKLLRHADLRYARLKVHSESKASALQSFESDDFHLRIPLGDLFRNKLIVQVFKLDGGRLNLQEAAENPQEEQKKDEGGLDSLPSIFINLAAVNDARIRYKPLEGKGWAFTVNRLFLSSPGKRLKTAISGSGEFNESPVEVIGQTVSLDEFLDADKLPIWLHAALGPNTFEIDGSVRTANASTNLKLKAAGPNLEEFKRLFQVNIAPVPAYDLSLTSVTEGKKIDLKDINLKIGRSSLTGTASLNFNGAKPNIKANLVSPILAQSDLAPFFQTDPKYKDANEPPKAPGQYFSDKPIETDVLKSINVDVKYKVTRYIGEKAGRILRGGYAHLVLNNSDLKMEPLIFYTEHGSIAGTFLFDARKKPIDVAIGLRAQKVDLNALLKPVATEVPVLGLKPGEMARGILTGHLDLKMKGNTPMQLAKTAKGPIALVVEEGALSGTIIEAFGIDITETVRNWIQDHPLYEMKCMLTSFDVADGAINTKAFLISTKDTSIIGKGGISLVGNKVDYRLDAHPHDFSIGSLRSPILIEGKLNDFGVSLKKEPIGIRAGAAIALGSLVNPLLALLPLTETGLDKKGQCKGVVDEIRVAQEKSKIPPSETVGR